MSLLLPGIHHVTAISGAAQENIDFYTRVLGLRLVKTTVNFDDPTTYHLYYGDRTGRPGTALTFFPWARAVNGRTGAGMASRIALAVPDGTLDAWQARLEEAGVDATTESVFDTHRLTFAAPDGLPLALVSDPNRPVGDTADSVWTTASVPASQAIRGFYGTTLPAVNASQTAALFTDVFGWTVVAESDERIRLQAPATASEEETSRIPLGTIVDLKTRPAQTAGRMGKGAVHHVAFRARDDDEQAAWQSRLRERGLQVTDVKDRQYFRSIYFRDADWTSGILFEIATDGPGFLIDESEERLGRTLRLPSWLEDRRDELEQALPSIERPAPASSST